MSPTSQTPRRLKPAMNKFPIGARLGLGFAMLIGANLSLAAFGFWHLGGQPAGLVMLGGAGLVAVLGALIGWRLSRSITLPLAQAVAIARTVAAGDLSASIEPCSSDETGQLLEALRTMNESLVGLVGEVRHSSDAIANGSAQIAAGNADLSGRTELQAANLQEAAASMDQLNGSVKANADAAQRAAGLASAASRAAEQGGEVVTRVAGTMAEILASSRQIAEIVGMIDGIAIQTNLLALNAAIEAAHAGESGRSFGVVAAEVRGLAHRSAGAARQIKDLVARSVEKAAAGASLAGSAGESMGDIVDQVRHVAVLMGEIGAASRRQTESLGQVSDAVGQLDRATQENAALVGHSATSSDGLMHQSQRLAEIVGLFQLGSEQAAPRCHPPSASGITEWDPA
jgi:methyl-accepting chemotaxis protein